MKQTVRISCTTRRGSFSGEYVVAVQLLDSLMEFMADRSALTLEREPTGLEDVPGQLDVYLVHRREREAKVLVPASPASDPRYIHVPTELPARVEAHQAPT